jgi:hypothetical protein
MTSHRWGWIGACSTGTSHLRAGRGCDDAGGCVEVGTQWGPTLVAIVSDGAGSASLSGIGARIVALEFCRSVSNFVRHGGRATEVDLELTYSWLDRIRDRIGLVANLRRDSRRSFAATLVGCIVQLEGTTVIHIGDGACAIRCAGSDVWTIPSWPAQGEYASTTFFVTDDPQPSVTISRLEGPVEEFALFSDGLERLALDFSTSTAFSRFFEPMFRPLRTAPPGRNRRLSLELRKFLDSQRVTDRTDDDKTLIMARRVAAA